MKDNKTKPKWVPYPLNTPSDNKPKYVTTVLRVGTTDIRRVIKAKYIKTAESHSRLEHMPASQARWEGPGWYADGGELGMGCFPISALYFVKDVTAFMPIPDIPEPYEED